MTQSFELDGWRRPSDRKAILVIPQNDLAAGYAQYQPLIDTAVDRVAKSGFYVLGREVERFEHEFSGYVGVSHGVGVASGTDAIEVALRACHIGPGDLVLTVSHTAVATVAGIERSGAAVALVDIDPATYTMSPASLESVIATLPGDAPRPKAVVPVHLYGQLADMPAICDIAQKHGLRVIEDCAQAHGAALGDRRAGTWGVAAAFSFYPTKNLGALGDAGLIVTDDAALANDARQLRQYGWGDQRLSQRVGVNSRLDELQAAILVEKLTLLDLDNDRRREIAGAYNEALAAAEIKTPATRENSDHVYHQYVIQSDRRDALREFLAERNIGTAIHYPRAVHQQPAYQDRLMGCERLPATEELVPTILSLPIYPQLNDDRLAEIRVALHAWSRRS